MRHLSNTTYETSPYVFHLRIPRQSREPGRPYQPSTQQTIFLPMHGTFSGALYILVISCRSAATIHSLSAPSSAFIDGSLLYPTGSLLPPSLSLFFDEFIVLRIRNVAKIARAPCESERKKATLPLSLNPGREISFRIHAVRMTGTPGESRSSYRDGEEEMG